MAGDILREEGLPTTTPRYQYQGIKQCLRCFELELERYNRDGQPADYSYIIFDHVDERSFQECFEDESGESLLTHSFVTYNFISLTIVMKLPTPTHETAHRSFSEIFATWSRGQESRLVPIGRVTIEGSTRRKCPDSSWKSSIQAPGRDLKWPTILVEVGWSESRAKLREDVLFWLRESTQQVKVALTIEVTRTGNITVEQWELDQNTGGTSVQPIQTMKISRKRLTGPNQYHITGSMDIQFDDCFLRAKRGSETDFHLSNDDMKEIAEAVRSSRS
ncbi:unnamed protein product [Penicillium egyptiacum]|uniref:Uncharacterized protein n=1 Tax=Penicillium egyptiacum TaxID=1303716 RepID=A0A9W4P9Y2_9EURO|nr:unnamed protein product [Penicillium egyptiacum]